MFIAELPGLHAQGIASAVDTLYVNTGDTIILSHKHLVPFSLHIHFGREAGASQVIPDFVDLDQGILTLVQDSPTGYYLFQYRYFTNTPAEYIGLYDRIPTTDTAGISATPLLPQAPLPYIEETSRINKVGILTRGINIGNQGNVSLNGGLRLQLEGELSEGLHVMGSITDENLPIQPDGSTYQLADLDKIFLQFSKDGYLLTLGDHEVSEKRTNFANYFRNVQGMKFETSKNGTLLKAGFALAKGIFHSNAFVGKEGIAGPYRLSGKKNELYFFVLAGTEKVYLNGRLMIRGEQNDYVINYNTAEVSFTSRHVISSQSRIVVDFEYNDRSFSKSLFTSDYSGKLWKDKLQFGLTYQRDADNANVPLEEADVYTAQLDTLRIAGDKPLSLLSGIQEDQDETNAIRYVKKDTLVAGAIYEVFFVNFKPGAAGYRLSFRYVGPGQGYYVRDNSGLNRQVYTWVGPDEAGMPKGDFSPYRILPLPEITELIDVWSELQLSPQLRLRTETALSRVDKNRYSAIDDNDNTDWAHITRLDVRELRLHPSWKLSMDLTYSHTGENFSNLERVQVAEYNRLWNIPEASTRANEDLGTVALRLAYKNHWLLGVEKGLRFTSFGTDGRSVYSVEKSGVQRISGNYTFTHLTSDRPDSSLSSTWLRHEGEAFIRIMKWRLGAALWIEDKQTTQKDSLRLGSFAFVDIKPFLKSGEEGKFQWELSYNFRKEHEWQAGSLRPKSDAYTYRFLGNYSIGTTFRFVSNISQRNFKVLDPVFALQGLRDFKGLQFLFETQTQTKNRSWVAFMQYEANNEQISRQELRYVEVNPGQGLYEWIDLNENEIQELNEFQLSVNPLLANYIRVGIPSRDFQAANRIQFSGNIRGNWPKLNWLKTITYFRLQQNRLPEASGAGKNFWTSGIPIRQDTATLQANNQFRQDIAFFQNNPKFGGLLSYVHNLSILFLTGGKEIRKQHTAGLSMRLSLKTESSVETLFQLGERTYKDALRPAQAYDVLFVDNSFKYNRQFSARLRGTLGYRYIGKNNIDSQAESWKRISGHEANAEIRWNYAAKSNLTTTLRYIQLRQIGEIDPFAGYELREGFLPGANLHLQLQSNVRLKSRIELQFVYDGRKSQDRALLHSGRIQVRTQL